MIRTFFSKTLGPVVLCVVLICAVSISFGADPSKTGTIEGEVLKIDTQNIVVKKNEDGQEVSLSIGHQAKIGGELKKGDQVEVMVTPQGIVTSVLPLKGGLRR